MKQEKSQAYLAQRVEVTLESDDRRFRARDCYFSTVMLNFHPVEGSGTFVELTLTDLKTPEDMEIPTNLSSIHFDLYVIAMLNLFRSLAGRDGDIVDVEELLTYESAEAISFDFSSGNPFSTISMQYELADMTLDASMGSLSIGSLEPHPVLDTYIGLGLKFSNLDLIEVITSELEARRHLDRSNNVESRHLGSHDRQEERRSYVESVLKERETRRARVHLVEQDPEVVTVHVKTEDAS